ncbi:MAG: DNA-directed RNA polymerase subunit beta [Schleiferilactobacillus harbinensis]|jgi:hypothetical protein|nr:DNA-directed RNA polymerase subunit beta [Schleiferilactobacillus harbinensis]MCI1913127.1 DNA-directed RNA polymerase subunit beta [Schleiferilactobacillus harbinensis]
MDRNVAPANWLYPDRGMVKWPGYFLSDHTTYMEDENSVEQPIAEENQQSPKLISSTLNDTWQQKKIVSIQLNELQNGQHSPNLTGLISGFDAGFLYLQNDDDLQIIPTSVIRHVQLTTQGKWWDRA